jgi:hypothetical protein
MAGSWSTAVPPAASADSPGWEQREAVAAVAAVELAVDFVKCFADLQAGLIHRVPVVLLATELTLPVGKDCRHRSAGPLAAESADGQSDQAAA